MSVYILYTDETNAEPGERVDFFIYGGVWLPLDRLGDLHDLVERIRGDANYRATDILKFDSRSAPEHVTRAAHTEAKRAVLDAARQVGLRFTAALVLHDIATSRDRRWSYQADAVLMAFRDFLAQEDASGMVVMDRTADIYDFVREKFQRGAIYRRTGTAYPLRGVHLVAAAPVGSSHLSSVADIVLGSFRYCVNDTSETAATRAMLPAVVRLMWYLRQPDGSIRVRDRGLLFRPRAITHQPHQLRYDELTARLVRVLETAEGFVPPGTDDAAA